MRNELTSRQQHRAAAQSPRRRRVPGKELPRGTREGTVKRGDGALDWSALVALIVHPTKVLIVEAIGWIDRPLSSSELAYVFGETMSVSAISYHVNSLARYGVLRRQGRHKVRGAWKTLYVISNAVALPGGEPASRGRKSK